MTPMSLIKSITSWRPQTPFFYGWLVLGTASLAAFAATGVAQIVIGGIQNLIFEDLEWDRSTIAYAVTAGTWTSGLLTPFFGQLADRYGPRWLMPAATIVVGICFFAISGVRAVWHFYAAYIVARAIANPILIGVVPRTAAVNFFRRKRNFVLGLSATARPVGAAANVQIISLIAQGFSWRIAYRFLGVFSLVLAVPLFLIMRRRPEDIGLQPDGDRPPQTGGLLKQRDHTPEKPSQSEPREFGWRVGEAAATSTFWMIVVADSLAMVAGGALGFQIVPFLKDAGLSQTVAAVALSLAILLGALVNPGWGYLADRFPARRLGLIGLVVTAVIMSLLLVTDSGPWVFVLVILWGTASGGLTILSNMMLAQYFGRSSFGAITGLMGPFQIGALGLGPTFGAVLFNLTGDYKSLFLFGVAAYSLALVLIYGVRSPKAPRKARDESDTSRG